MESRIFRKVSLDRLSSPEQLDQILRVTNAKSWGALIGILLLLGVSVVWGYQGSVASKAAGQGLVVRSGGVLNVVTAGSGMVVDLNVKVGDHISRNQVIAKVAQPALIEKIRDTQQMLAEARAQEDLSKKLHGQNAKLQGDALQNQRENAKRQIEEAKAQIKIVEEQIPVDEQLLAKGLITKQQTFPNRQKLVELRGKIESLNAQLREFDAQQFGIEAQPVQNQVEMQSRIADLQRTLASLNAELAMTSNVVASYGGEVIELKVYPGAAVQAGSPLLSLQPQQDRLEALVYLPSDKAKDVQLGMEAQLSPSTVKREEYGFLRGKVTYVSNYPSTPAALMRNFQNEALVQSLTANGPVTELRVEMLPDKSTRSGFAWSSPGGPPLTLSSGTLCTTQIVTRRQRPVSLVFPYVREKLGIS